LLENTCEQADLTIPQTGAGDSENADLLQIALRLF
jgi:hypothetical protein